MRDPAGAQRCAAGRAFVERSRRVSTAGNAVGCNRRGALPVLLQAQYDAWGNVTSYSVKGMEQGTDLSAWPLPHGFAGGLLDVDTGLLRFGARDYDPSVGRWTAKDPILFNGGQANLWVYVGNDPVNFVDPAGLSSIRDFFDGAASFGVDVGIAATHIAAENGFLGGELQSYANRLNSIVGAGLTAGLYGAPSDTLQRAFDAAGNNKAFLTGRGVFGLFSTLAVNRAGGGKVGLGLGALALEGGILRLAMEGSDVIAPYEAMFGVDVVDVCQ